MPQLQKTVRLVLLDPPAEKVKPVADTVIVDDFAREMSGCVRNVESDETDGLAITLTGGTTGLPKAVLVSHKARYATAVAAADAFGLREDDIMLASTPLFHTVGLFV